MKHFLLDTQVALWLLTGSERLSERDFRARFCSGESRLIFHQVSTWEIQIKFELGKLSLPARPQTFLLQAVAQAGLCYERIDDEGIFFLDRLPPLHRDPFDRLLVSHAISHGWVLVSADEMLERYSVPFERV